jgi:hypothetical protein
MYVYTYIHTYIQDAESQLSRALDLPADGGEISVVGGEGGGGGTQAGAEDELRVELRGMHALIVQVYNLN